MVEHLDGRHEQRQAVDHPARENCLPGVVHEPEKQNNIQVKTCQAPNNYCLTQPEKQCQNLSQAYYSCALSSNIQSNLLERPPPNKDHLQAKTRCLTPQMVNSDRN